MALRRLSGVDTAFLAAERPGNLLHVMGLLILDPSSTPGGYSFDKFRAFAEERMPGLPPLRRRLVEVPGGLARPFWTETEVDLDAHIHRAAVPSPGTAVELAAMAADFEERPLDRSRPLWEMLLVEGLEGGRIALLAKLHHAMMDGMAGVKLMASLFSTTPEIEPPPEIEAEPPQRAPGPIELVAGAVPWLMRQPLRAARAGFGSARSLLRSALPDRSPPAPATHPAHMWLNQPISPFRSVAYVSLPMAELKALGARQGATVNDILLCVVGGALRRYLGERDVLPPDPLVASVPVTLRGDDDDDRSNAVSTVSVELGTDEADPIVRLAAIRSDMAALKRRRGSTVGEDLAAWADVPPPLVFSLLMRAYVDLGLAQRMDPICNLVISSVPGPPVPLYLGGARLVGIHPLGPIYSGVALNVTAMGCGDNLDIGLVGCRRRMPDIWELADAIPAALAELKANAA